MGEIDGNLELRMTQFQLDQIRQAYQSGDIARARNIIEDALRSNPSPQLYRMAAELARSEGQKTYYLEKAQELESIQPGGGSLPASHDFTTTRPCPYCGVPNTTENIYCGSCGGSMNVPYTSTPAPPTPTKERGIKTSWIVGGILTLCLCLWAAGLIFAAMRIFRGDVGTTSSPDLTSTALASLISTPETLASPTPIPDTDTPLDTAIPTNTLESMPVPTGTATPMIDLPDLEAGRVTTEDYNFYNPAVSPGHLALAAAMAVNDNWQIVEVDPTSGLITQEITDQDHVYTNPHYSNDGRTLLLRANLSGNYNIYLVDADNGDIIQALTDYPESVGYPRWMPDNQSFLYKRYSNEDAEIFIGYLDGSSPTQLTANNRYDGSPASSPDGRSIAMSSFIDGNYEILVLDRDSGEFRQLSFDPGRDSEPVFSPDGEWIAFESDRGGDYNIWVIRPDGSGLKQVTFDSRNELIPAFSPDGGWLYFQQRQANGNFSINRLPWP